MDSNGTEVIAVRLVFCGLNGARRCRIVPIEQYKKACAHGIGMAECVVSLPIFADVLPPESALTPCGEFRLMPQTDSMVVLPWHPKHTRTMVAMESVPGTPSLYCPINALKLATDYLKDKYGFEMKVGFETEFVLLDPKKAMASNPNMPAPVDSAIYSTVDAIENVADVLDDIVLALKAVDVKVEQIHAESCHGQFELVAGAYPGMDAANKLLLTRDTISAISKKHGLVASFIPKIYAKQAGSGAHCHFSVSKDGKDATSGSTKESLSAAGESFTAGILRHLTAVGCFTAPSALSYSRIAPGCWAGAHKVWGVSNKEAPLRLLPRTPSEEGGTTHLEMKTFDATANPHIGLAAMIVAGTMGLEQNLKLPESIEVDPRTVAEEKGLEKMPESLGGAIQAFEEDAEFKAQFKKVIGAEVMHEFIAVRKSEESHYSKMSFQELVEDLYIRY